MGGSKGKEQKSKAGILVLGVFIVALISLSTIFWSEIEKQFFLPEGSVANLLKQKNDEETRQLDKIAANDFPNKR